MNRIKIARLGIGGALSLALLFGSPFSQEANAWEANMHRVEKGESFWAIGRLYGIDPHDLAAYNNMPIDRIIHPGDKLALPEEVAEEPAELSPETTKYALTKEEYELLALVVQQEAGPGQYEGSLWVMTTILNRVDGADYFGNSIIEVIRAENQFEAYFAGHYERHRGRVTPQTTQAITDALNGTRPHTYEFFYAADFAAAKGITGETVAGNTYYRH